MREQPETAPFEARVIEPDQQARREREALHKAVAAKIEQLTQLMERALAAGDLHLTEEAEFWRQELER